LVTCIIETWQIGLVACPTGPGWMPKILIVDDDQELQVMVADFLEHHRFTVESALTGLDARERISAFSYDVIVLDWGLPGDSGLEICRWYRSRGGQTPILILTGKDKIDDKESGFDSGADDYLTKPFDVRELLARLNALLRRGGLVSPSRVLTLGNLTLDPVAHSARLDGNDIQLTPKEFDILEFFMAHPDQLFSAEMLLDRLWRDGADIAPDTVRVYIKRLREKLKLYGSEALIVNVHGLGYKLICNRS
jgi:DNA-binding response OmpR family regulator